MGFLSRHFILFAVTIMAGGGSLPPGQTYPNSIALVRPVRVTFSQWGARASSIRRPPPSAADRQSARWQLNRRRREASRLPPPPQRALRFRAHRAHATLSSLDGPRLIRARLPAAALGRIAPRCHPPVSPPSLFFSPAADSGFHPSLLFSLTPPLDTTPGPQIFLYNIIVGTGVLALPAILARAGVLLWRPAQWPRWRPYSLAGIF